MPRKMTQAHIVPGLAHSSLISTKAFCDAGCNVSFDEFECRVYFKNKLMLAGSRDPKTMLWRLPINPKAPPSAGNTVAQKKLQLSTQQQISHASHFANNVHTFPYLQNQVKYMHQKFFSQPKHTLIKAINNNQLKGVSFVQADLLRKHLAQSPAVPKGRTRRPGKGLRSTRRKKKGRRDKIQEQEENENELRMKDDKEEKHAGYNNIFCYAVLADKQTGTIYTDATGALPHVSLEGSQYYFVAYDYDTNASFAIPIKDLKDETIITAFDEIFKDLTEKGYKPQFNVIDNQDTTPLKAYLKKEDCTWQFVEPTNYRVNAAERAIQTYKNHMISGLSTTDVDF